MTREIVQGLRHLPCMWPTPVQSPKPRAKSNPLALPAVNQHASPPPQNNRQDLEYSHDVKCKP